MPAPHRIRRQRWTVRAGSAEQALSVRRRLRDDWEPVLLPAFEAAFDAAAPGDAVVRIPRLEIRLRVDEGDGWMDELPALVRDAVAEQLRALALPAAFHGGGDGPAAARTASPAQDARATLLHYLRTGSLPWAAQGAPAPETAGALRAAAREGWRAAAAALRAAREPEAPWFRLVHLLDSGDAAALVEAFGAHLPPEWRRALARLVSGDGDAVRLVPGEHARLRTAAALLARGDAIAPTPASPVPAGDSGTATAEGERARNAAVTAIRALGVAAAEADALATLAAGEATGPRAAGGRGGRGRRGQAASASGERRAGGRRGADERAPEADAAGDIRGDGDASPLASPASGDAAEAERAADLHAPSASRGDEEEDDFPTPVANAGLVLIHSFIPMLFRHLGIAEDGALAEDRLPRAAALLHLLATGRTDVHEFELGMIRVLLGLGPSGALPVAEGCLEPGDAEEADALLRAAIDHWGVLKGTSPEGLRGSFLCRPGLLRELEHGWRLQVEPAPWDVLLDHLPWSFSLVKLPWMPHPVHVEWNTTR